MTIYLSHSKAFDFHKEYYEIMQNSSLAQKHKLILPHLNSSNPYPTKELMVNKECDLVIAEVSFPSTGQGIELGWADIVGIPILCIYKKNHKFAGSLNLISDCFFEYEDLKDILTLLETKIETSIKTK